MGSTGGGETTHGLSVVELMVVHIWTHAIRSVFYLNNPRQLNGHCGVVYRELQLVLCAWGLASKTTTTTHNVVHDYDGRWTLFSSDGVGVGKLRICMMQHNESMLWTP